MQCNLSNHRALEWDKRITDKESSPQSLQKCSISKALYTDLKSILVLYAFDQRSEKEKLTEKGDMDIFTMGTVDPEGVRKC